MFRGEYVPFIFGIRKRSQAKKHCKAESNADSANEGTLHKHYQKKKKVVGLERGPLSPGTTTEELLDRKVVAPV
jgi:hypothetical protein